MSKILTPLSKIANVESGQGAPQDASHFGETGMPFIRAGSLPKLLSNDEETDLEKVTEAGAKANRLKVFPSGSILFAKSGMSATLGHVYLTKGPAYVVNHLAVITPKDGLDARYLLHYFRHSPPTKLIRDSGYPSIRLSDIAALNIPLPSLAEQRRIAGILDKVDELRALRRQALSRLDDLAQSVFFEMFGDPVKNDRNWTAKSIGELGKVTTGSTPSGKLEGMYGGDLPFVTPGDLGTYIESGKRTLSVKGMESVRRVRKGAALVCCIGATIGKMGFATVEVGFNQQINAVEWGPQIGDLFGYHTLRFFAPTIAKKAPNTTLPILKKSEFEKIKIPVPAIEFQMRFEKYIAKQHQIEKQQIEHKNLLEKLRISLTQSLLRF